MKPLQEEITQLLNDAERMQNTDSGNEVEVKILLSNQDNLLNQIKKIEETKIPSLREQIDTLREEKSTKQGTLRGIHEAMKPKVEELNEIRGEINSKRAALEATILDILEAANEKYNKD